MWVYIGYGYMPVCMLYIDLYFYCLFVMLALMRYSCAFVGIKSKMTCKGHFCSTGSTTCCCCCCRCCFLLFAFSSYLLLVVVCIELFFALSCCCFAVLTYLSVCLCILVLCIFALHLWAIVSSGSAMQNGYKC